MVVSEQSLFVCAQQTKILLLFVLPRDIWFIVFFPAWLGECRAACDWSRGNLRVYGLFVSEQLLLYVRSRPKFCWILSFHVLSDSLIDWFFFPALIRRVSSRVRLESWEFPGWGSHFNMTAPPGLAITHAEKAHGWDWLDTFSIFAGKRGAGWGVEKAEICKKKKKFTGDYFVYWLFVCTYARYAEIVPLVSESCVYCTRQA